MLKHTQKNHLKSLSAILLTTVLCATLGIQTFIFHTPKAEAAAVTWVGGDSGVWSVAGNWSNNAVPTSSDDITLTTGGLLIVTADINISFNSLTIGGDSGGSVNMKLQGNITSGGNITIKTTGSLIQSNFVAQTITGTLTMNSGSQLQHDNNTTTESYKIDITAGTITINSGATINVDGRGYEGGTFGNDGSGSGAGVNTNVNQKGSGAGHGGRGGDDGGDGSVVDAGGSAYCTSTNPATLGSGGGGGGNVKGGDGGGLVRLTSTGDITIAGTISANGDDGAEDSSYDAGGGAGGGIRIYGNTVNVSNATIRANGGNSGTDYNSGGAGGGGCIFISYTSYTNTSLTSSVTAGTGVNALANSAANGTLTTDARTPNMNFSSSSSSFAESSSCAVTVQLSASTGSDVTANYSVAGTATSGTDYTPLSGNITVTGGSTSATINITFTDDTTDEADETVILTLYNVSSNALIGSTTAHTCTITDNDSGPTVQFTSTTSSDSEGNLAPLIGVSLSAASAQNVTVDYAVTGISTATGTGTDYTLTNDTLTIEAGKTSKNIAITGVNDSMIESDETIVISLSNATNATVGANATHTYTIKDNDGTPTVQFVLANSEAAEGTSPNIAVQLSKAPTAGQDVQVTYTVNGGTAVSPTNYMLTSPGTLTLTNTTPVNITPTIATDPDSINQTMLITLSGSVNANLGANMTHLLTIKEASVTSSAPTNLTVNGSPTPATVATENPVFGWKFVPGVTSDSERAFQLLIATSEANLSGGTYACDTGKVTNRYSAHAYSNICTGSLLAGTFYWKVRTYNSTDTASSYSSVQTFTISGVITPPAVCTQNSTAATSFTLGWTDNSSNETGFEVEQSLATGFSSVTDGLWRRITTTPANAVSYDITGLIPNKIYHYRVRAVNNTGASTYLTCSSSFNTLAQTPDAPSVAALSTTSLRIIINTASNDPSVQYAINVNTTQYVQANGTLGASSVYQVVSGWSERGVTVTGLSPNTAYIVNVIARDRNNQTTSASSSTTRYTLAEKMIVSTSSPASSSFNFSLGVNGNPAGTLAAVTVFDGTQTRYAQINGSLGHTSVTQTPAIWSSLQLTSLTTSTNFRLQAIAYNGDNIPTYSFPAAARTQASSPTSFRVTALADISASLYVDTQSGYQYLFDSDPGGLQADNTENISVSNNTSGNHTIKLNNGSDTPTVTMAFCGGVLTPGTPILDTTPLTDRQFRIAIDASTNSASTEYLIHEIVTNKYVTTLGTLVSVDAVNWSTIWTTKANFGGDTGVTITGLTPAEDYEFEIKARNCQNIETTYSATRIASTNPIVPAAPTATLTSDSTGSAAAKIVINTGSLSALTLANMTDFAIYDATTNQYVTNVSGNSSGNGILGASESWRKYDEWGGSNGYLITSLSPNVTHQFAIKAKKTTNSSPVETALSQKTALVTSANRSFITLESTTTSSISLSVNPYGNSSSTEYSFELVPSSGSSTYLQSGGTNNTFNATQSWATLTNWFGYDGTSDEVLAISGLSPNTSSTFRVHARNSDQTAGYQSPTATIYTAAATPTSATATATSDARINLTWGVASNPSSTEYLISESSTGKYIVGNALSTSSTWSAFDNTTPTNATYVASLTAGTQYCFTIKARNGHASEGTAAAAVCATTTAASSGSSSSGGVGSSSTSSTPAATTTPATTTPATTTETPKTETKPIATPVPATEKPAEPAAPTPAATPAPTPTVAPTPAATPAPAPITTSTPTPTAPATSGNSSAGSSTSAPTSSSGGGGGTSASDSSSGGTSVNPEEFKKQLEELKKQKEEGLITFQIGGLKKEVRTKAETGITREIFVASLITDLDLKKVYSKALKASKDETTEKIAQELNILSVFTDAGGNYDKTKFLTNIEAYRATLVAINLTEGQACKEKIFDFCTPPNPNEKLTKDVSDSLFRSAKNFLAAQNQARSRKADTDHDKLPDWDEINIHGTDPTKSDTDGDSLSDSEEIATSRLDPLNPKDKSLNYKTDPLTADTDGDSLSDSEEIKTHKTNARKLDTDGDGYSDKIEIDKGTNPVDPLDFPKNVELGKGTQDSDKDGLCDRCETGIGTDPQNPDTDRDTLSDSLDPEPLKFNAKNEPIKLKITNIQSGMKTATSPLVQGTAQANTEIAIIAKNEFGLKREIGRVQTSENNIFAADLKPLPNGTFYLEAQDEKGNTSPQVTITIDSTLKVEAPRLETIDDKPLKADYEPEVSSSPLIKARLLSGKAIITFRSAIGTATLISDSPTGTLEIRPPENLALGEHEVIAYAVREDDNAISSIVKYRFKVTQASEYNANDFFIKNGQGGAAGFFREKTVWPIFQKIFIGAGLLLALWFMISLIQFTRGKKK